MTKLEKFEYAKNVACWTCDLDGNVYNKKGRKIGSCNNNLGYYESSLAKNNKKFNIRLHQFIYWFFKNELPIQIDDIDNNRENNKLSNLRAVTNQQNSFNRKSKGYSITKHGKYFARIGYNYKTIPIGSFDSHKEAHEAYLNAKQKLHLMK